jgi:hypothetical protein
LSKLAIEGSFNYKFYCFIMMKKLSLIGATLLLPVLTFAQATTGRLSVIENMAGSVRTIVQILIPVAFGLGILAFFWGLVKYLFGSDHDKDQAKKTMLWGVIAIFVMASIWGLVRFIGTTFGVDPNAAVPQAENLSPLR